MGSKYKEKKITWSKGIVLVTGIIFIISLIFCGYAFLTQQTESIVDTTAIGVMITVSGSIFGSNLCWYSKKAASENQYKLRMSLYRESTTIRLKYNEKMMQLMTKYKMRQEDIDKINDNSEIDDMTNKALEKIETCLDNTEEDADSKNEIEQFN